MVSLRGKTARTRGLCSQTCACARGQRPGPKVRCFSTMLPSSTSTSRPCGDCPGTHAHSVPSAPGVPPHRSPYSALSRLRGRRQTSPLSACARSSGVHWRPSLPSGARESGERARTPLLSRGAGRRVAPHLPPPGPVPVTSGCTGLATLQWGWGGDRKSQGWGACGGCAPLPHPRHPQKGTNEKANTPEAGAAAYDATRNEQGLFFMGAQLLPRRRRQRLSPLSGQQPPSPTPPSLSPTPSSSW